MSRAGGGQCYLKSDIATPQESALPVSTYLHRDANVRVSVFEGKVCPDDLVRLGRMFHNANAFRAGDPAFAVFRPDVKLSALDPEDLLDLENAVGDAFAGRRREVIKVAVVAKSAAVGSQLRLWREITKPASGYRYTYEVFGAFEEAVRWHGLDPEWAGRIRELEGFREVA